ncbi:hypothetical protein FHW20_004294 [Ochrobactrum intermedium]|uniref:Uncharacterized protein n=1 Tax=Brucella intermedia TaxID=94625 RepID=A0ABR6AV17_9HYPH|nr:hypothetical protein [Brucella intermedia]MBA8853314.1 hypothetical protein [Brucella intermedia]
MKTASIFDICQIVLSLVNTFPPTPKSSQKKEPSTGSAITGQIYTQNLPIRLITLNPLNRNVIVAAQLPSGLMLLFPFLSFLHERLTFVDHLSNIVKTTARPLKPAAEQLPPPEEMHWNFCWMWRD